MSENISDLQARIAALEEENQRLWTVLNYVPYHLWVKDTAHRFVVINKAAAEIMGVHTIDDLLGKTDLDLHPPELAEQFMAEEAHLMETKTSFSNLEQGSYKPETREPLLFATSKSPTYDEDGNVTGLVGYSEDITWRKQAEQEHAKQERVIDEQEQELVELSTPVLPVLDNILLIPIIGNVDEKRAQQMMRRILVAIGEHHAHMIILDISGVTLIDTAVAAYLNRTIVAARLKGAQVIVTGISDSVAETIVDLGIDWTRIVTLRDLQSGLEYALKKRAD